MYAAEMIGMFICQLVILETVCHKDNKVGNMAPQVIGTTFALVVLAIAPISGASLNPARSLGPAIMSGYFSNLWIYLAAPTCGESSVLGVFEPVSSLPCQCGLCIAPQWWQACSHTLSFLCRCSACCASASVLNH